MKEVKKEDVILYPTAYQRVLFLEHQGDLDLSTIPKASPRPDAYEINPLLRPQVKAKSKSAAEELSVNSRANIGEFYKHLYAALFHRESEATYKYIEIISQNGKGVKKFEPDITIESLHGHQYTEVKSVNLNAARQDFRVEQVENYSWALLDRLAKGDKLPSVEVAFVRYGDSRDSLKLYLKSSKEAAKQLAREISDVVVMPLNLTFLLCGLSKREKRPRDDGYDQEFFRISGRAISLLHEMEEFDLNYFMREYVNHVERNLKWLPARGRITIYKKAIEEEKLEEAKKFAKRSSLCLDDLVVLRRRSDQLRPMRYAGVEVKPFPVTIYALRNYEKWLDSFKRNHRDILKAIGVNDLYHQLNNPF